MVTWNDVLTLTRLDGAELDLLLLVGELAGVLLTEQCIQPALVMGLVNTNFKRQTNQTNFKLNNQCLLQVLITSALSAAYAITTRRGKKRKVTTASQISTLEGEMTTSTSTSHT